MKKNMCAISKLQQVTDKLCTDKNGSRISLQAAGPLININKSSFFVSLLVSFTVLVQQFMKKQFYDQDIFCFYCYMACFMYSDSHVTPLCYLPHFLGWIHGGHDACQGDSGGPLVALLPGMFVCNIITKRFDSFSKIHYQKHYLPTVQLFTSVLFEKVIFTLSSDKEILEIGSRKTILSLISRKLVGERGERFGRRRQQYRIKNRPKKFLTKWSPLSSESSAGDWDALDRHMQVLIQLKQYTCKLQSSQS